MKLRELILGACLVLGFVAKADAQDRWNGWYGGFSLNGTDSASQVGTNTTHDYKQENGSVGAFVGYNKAGRGNYVWGGELALSGLGARGERTDATLGTSKLKGDVLVTTKFRAGYATDKAYYYGIAGLGFSSFGAEPATGAADSVTGALGFGIGAEFALDDNWSVKTEAMHFAWEDDAHAFNGTRPKVDSKITQISIGIARKF